MDEKLFKKYNQAMIDGDFNKALLLLEEELKKEPKDKLKKLSLLYHIGYVYRWSGDYKKAKEYYTKALEINPNDSSPNQGLGIIYQMEGNYEKAIEYLNKAIAAAESGGSRATYYNSLGLTYRLNGDYKNALESYFKGISDLFEEICDDLEKRGTMEVIPPRYMDSTEWARFALNALLANTTKHDDIKSLMTPTSETATNFWKEGKPSPCWKDIDGKRFQTPQYIEAVRLILMSDLLYANLTNNIGVVYSTLGDKEEAKKWYKESIALTPDNVDYPNPRMGLEALEERE